MQAAIESFRDGLGIVEAAVLDVMPADPALADQEGRRRLEDRDQADLGRIERPNPFVRRESFTGGRSGRRPTTRRSSDARSAATDVDSHRAEIDQSAQAILLEEEMLRPSIAKHGLERGSRGRRPAERLEQDRGDVPGPAPATRVRPGDTSGRRSAG